MGYKVIADTREQNGWTFPQYQDCEGSYVGTLKTGDYSIEGLENFVCIERKASVEEISINIGSDKKRFYKELERMKDFKHKYIVCEFSIDDVLQFPNNSRIPKERIKDIKISGKYILKTMLEIEMEYGIHVMYCGTKNNAFITAASILKRIWEKYGRLK